MKSVLPKARKYLGRYSKKLSGFLLNNLLVYMFPRIQNETLKKECILVKIRGAIITKGSTKAEFSS